MSLSRQPPHTGTVEPAVAGTLFSANREPPADPFSRLLADSAAGGSRIALNASSRAAAMAILLRALVVAAALFYPPRSPLALWAARGLVPRTSNC